MMKTPPNYYKLLGVTASATEDEIRSAFRSQILQFHHDKTPGDPSDLCYQLIEAYRVLSNRNTRLGYDVQREKETRPLTDAELVEKYKNHVPRNERDELQVTPGILEELRNAHNRHRQEVNDEFIPAGAICYDVTNLLSTKFKIDIQKWETEFNPEQFSDNFFSAYQGVIERIQRHDSPRPSNTNFWCDLCRQNFISEYHHSQTVLLPYLSHFGLTNFDRKDNSWNRIKLLYQFFSDNVGEWFQWEPEPLPEIPEIWTYAAWKNLASVCAEVSAFVWELPNPEHFSDVDQHVTYVQKCTWANDGIVRWICWVLLNSDMTSLNSKALELLEENALGELFVYVGVLKEFLGFDPFDWNKMRQSSLEAGEFNMALLWTIVMVQLGFVGPQEFINYPINSGICKDPCPGGTSASIFFGLGMNSSTADVTIDSICAHFIESGDHLTAISYYINFGSQSALFSKYTEFCRAQPKVAEMYRTVFYSQKLKSILPTLMKEYEVAAGLEEVVEIMQLVLQDPSQGFRLLVQIFPERLAEPELYPIHSRAIQEFCISLEHSGQNNSLKLILAAWHFLGDENEVDEEFLQFHSQKVMKLKLAESLKTYDFESLTELLAGELNPRNVAALEEFLEELNQESQELPPHTRAMSLMISGSIQKLHKNWLGAISNFQEALLNTPEINYRLTPCISRLSQDFELHQGILHTVQEKLTELRSGFTAGLYVDFPEDVATSNSLVISHPTPLHDFQYCEMAGKIQTEEPKPPSNEDAVESSTQIPPPTNTPNVTLETCERAIELGEDKPLGPVDAAYAYLDLLESLPPHMRHGPLVMAASHFLRAMETAQDLRSAWAYRNSILELTHRLLQLDKTNQARVQSCLTHKHMFSILLLANQCLSKWSQERGSRVTNQEDASAEDENSSMKNLQTELISNSERTVIEKLLKSVVDFTKVEPLLNIPSLTSSDLGYVEKVKTQFLHHFCAEKVNRGAEFQLAPNFEQAYTLFLEVLHGRNLAVPFESAKRMFMDSILRGKGMRMESLVQVVDWPLGPNCNEDGWTDPSQPTSLQFHRQFQTFESIEGFKINLSTGEISFLLSKGAEGVVTQQDMFEIFQNGILAPSLKVSSPEPNEFNPHPFKCVHYEPSALAGTNYFKTMLRISRLLMTFTTGMEVNAHAPFLTREVEISFLDGLPEHLQHFLRPLRERTASAEKRSHENLAPAFSLTLTDYYYEESEDGDELLFTLGEAQMELTCAEDPISLDSNHNEEFSRSKSFVQDFNRNFQELGKYFPELRRLRELSRISVICSKLSEILTSRNYSSQVANGIKSLGLNSYEDAQENVEDVEYIPSPSCHSHPHVIDTTASVIVQPMLIYGPVSPSRMSTFVTLEELLEEPLNDFETETFENEVMYEVSTTVTVYLRKDFQTQESPVLSHHDDTNCQIEGNISWQEQGNQEGASQLQQLNEDFINKRGDSGTSSFDSSEISLTENGKRGSDLGEENGMETESEAEEEDMCSQESTGKSCEDDEEDKGENDCSTSRHGIRMEALAESSENDEEADECSLSGVEVKMDTSAESSECDEKDEGAHTEGEDRQRSTTLHEIMVELIAESSEEDEEDDGNAGVCSLSGVEIRMDSSAGSSDDEDEDNALEKDDPVTNDEIETESSDDEEDSLEEMIATQGGNYARMETILEGNENDCSEENEKLQKNETNWKTDEDESNDACSNSSSKQGVIMNGNLAPVELFIETSSVCSFSDEVTDFEESETEILNDFEEDDGDIVVRIRQLWD